MPFVNNICWGFGVSRFYSLSSLENPIVNVIAHYGEKLWLVLFSSFCLFSPLVFPGKSTSHNNHSTSFSIETFLLRFHSQCIQRSSVLRVLLFPSSVAVFVFSSPLYINTVEVKYYRNRLFTLSTQLMYDNMNRWCVSPFLSFSAPVWGRKCSCFG